jgi:hypothetical protein
MMLSVNGICSVQYYFSRPLETVPIANTSGTEDAMISGKVDPRKA